MKLSRAKMRELLSKAILVKLCILMMTMKTLTRPDVEDKGLVGEDVEAMLTKKIPTKFKSSNMATKSQIQY